MVMVVGNRSIMGAVCGAFVVVAIMAASRK